MTRIAHVSAAVVLAVLAACTDTLFESGGPLSIKLSADRTSARTAQDVTFTFDAKGSVLDAVIVEFGDGMADTLRTSGAQAARGRFIHAYRSAGTFTAVGTAYDLRQGQASDRIVIQVTGG